MTEPPLTDKQKVGEHARKVVAQARAIAARGRQLLAAPQRLQEAVRQQTAVLTREQVRAL